MSARAPDHDDDERWRAMAFATRAIHAGQSPDPTTGAVMTPVYFTSTYAQSAPGVHKGYEYSRTHNLTRFALEANLASLEGGAHGLCFASGLAATAAMSHSFSSGLVGVSIHTNFVVGLIAASTAAAPPSGSTYVNSKPRRRYTLSNSRNVPP